MTPFNKLVTMAPSSPFLRFWPRKPHILETMIISSRVGDKAYLFYYFLPPCCSSLHFYVLLLSSILETLNYVEERISDFLKKSRVFLKLEECLPPMRLHGVINLRLPVTKCWKQNEKAFPASFCATTVAGEEFKGLTYLTLGASKTDHLGLQHHLISEAKK